MRRIVFVLALLNACTGGFDDKGNDPDGRDGPDTDGFMDTDTDADTDAVVDDRIVGGTTLCAGGGIATNGTHTAVTCIGPAEVALSTTATDGTHTLQAGAIRRVSP